MPANFYAITLWDVAAWPPGNYAHPSETRDWLPAFAIVWQAVTTVLALGRLYLRLSRKAGAFGLDDAFLFMGWVCLRLAPPFTPCTTAEFESWEC